MNKLDTIAYAYNANPSEELYNAYMAQGEINNERRLAEQKARYAEMMSFVTELEIAA